MSTSKKLIWHKEEIEKVVKLLVSSKTAEEIEEIFDNILTPREIDNIARRYKTLLLLRQGKSYSEIQQETGMANSTIARISAKIGYGFRKSVKDNRKPTPKTKEWRPPRKTIRYKGVRTQLPF